MENENTHTLENVLPNLANDEKQQVIAVSRKFHKITSEYEKTFLLNAFWTEEEWSKIGRFLHLQPGGEGNLLPNINILIQVEHEAENQSEKMFFIDVNGFRKEGAQIRN